MIKPSIFLPIFPLNLVLYPGMFLPLHIFEPRYKAMINKCIDDQGPFGIVLLAEGIPEGNTDLKPYSPIGTTAKIIQVQKMAEGRMNIWVVGEQRFRLETWSISADEYLVGEANPLTEEVTDPLLYTQKRSQIKQKLDSYINLTVRLSPEPERDVNYALSEEPNLMSYQVASILDISLAEKQSLLEIDHLKARFDQEIMILDREIELLEQFVNVQKTAKTQNLPWGGQVHLN